MIIVMYYSPPIFWKNILLDNESLDVMLSSWKLFNFAIWCLRRVYEFVVDKLCRSCRKWRWWRQAYYYSSEFCNLKLKSAFQVDFIGLDSAPVIVIAVPLFIMSPLKSLILLRTSDSQLMYQFTLWERKVLLPTLQSRYPLLLPFSVPPLLKKIDLTVLVHLDIKFCLIL